MANLKYAGAFPSYTHISGDIIAQTAIDLAWPYGTKKSKYKYPSGSATAAFKKAFNIAYPTHKAWGKQTGKGASCDVFTGTCIRYSGYDKKIPRGLDGQKPYLLSHKNLWKATNVYRAKDMLPGDIIYYMKKGGGGHICIYIEVRGVGYIAEAGYVSKRYGVIARKAPNWSPSAYKFFKVFRAVKPLRTYWKFDDYSEEVLKIQRFLNWAGFNCGVPDRDYGMKTVNAVKAFQKVVGLKQNGIFDQSCLAKAKSYVKPSVNTVTAGKPATVPPNMISPKPSKPVTTTLKNYGGPYPILPKRGWFKVGDKGVQVSRTQSLLNWAVGPEIKKAQGKYLVVDGDYGNLTRGAVIIFEKKYGLRQDGEFGTRCLEKARTIKK